MKLLRPNKKLKKSQSKVLKFSLPAGRTCPMAGECRRYCYASKGTFKFKGSVAAHERNLQLSKQPKFSDRISTEIKAMHKRPAYIRIHDAGDFYSCAYLIKWIEVAAANPNIKFYAYTKSVSLLKSQANLPENFKVIYSYGGLEDAMIDPETDRHARIFASKEELLAAGYVNAMDNDTVACDNPNHRIGLVAH